MQKTISIFFEFINNNLEISLIVLIIIGIWEYMKYKNKWNFENYHKLVKELNQSDTLGESIKLYRQVAVVYEMRNYPRYFFVTKRILKGWLGLRNVNEQENKELYKEMELTLDYINKCWWKRLFME
jgi:hypothetical protein